ncbi:MAG: alpha-L-fucosidase [candidate division WS1 bacterium]|nr:alpha-L-fucosidase [candidate division WS1 bacterium]
MSDCYAWFNEAKFGMFLHWGLYSLLGLGEQIMFRGHLKPSDYRKLAARFTAPNYDAHEWARMARAAGMNYMVLTSKHHDGYCLFDSPGWDFCAPRTAPGRDLIAEYVEGCRAAGLRVGIYYSLQDWAFPVMFDGPDADPDKLERLVQKVHSDVRALCSNYGKIDLMWFDGHWPLHEAWRTVEIDDIIRELQPECMITGDRLHGAPSRFPDSPFARNERPGYIASSERRIVASEVKVPWEVCDVNQHRWWGYVKHDRHYRTGTELIYLLGEALGAGANLLLNFGPMGDGAFPQRAREQLEDLGRFTERNAEAIYGSSGANGLFEHLAIGDMTRKGETLYLWARYWQGESYHFAGLKNNIKRARVLGRDDIDVTVERDGDHIYLRGLPELPPDPAVTILAIDCEGEPEATDWGPYRLHGGAYDMRVWSEWIRS